MAGKILELRVHGVSNTPPAAMLDENVKPLERETGNSATGFYRVRGTGDATPVVEAYSWGGLTSGQQAVKDIQRALWTLLLPFTLANIALHARPKMTGWGAFNAWLIRVFGLTLTATLVLAATGVGVDLVGWQCVETSCLSAIPGPWEFLAGSWWHNSGRALAVGLLAPFVLLAVIGILSWRSYQYEAVLPSTAVGDSDNAATNPLRHSSFWSGHGQLRRLAVFHLTTGAAVAVGVPFAVMVAQYPPPGIVKAFGLILIAIPVLAIVALTTPGITSREGGSSIGGLAWTAILLTVLGCGGGIVFLLRSIPDDSALRMPRPGAGCRNDGTLAGCSSDLSLPGFDDVIFWLAAGQVALLLAIALVSILNRTKGAAWFGMGPVVFAGLGWMLGLAYSAGVLYWVTDVLNRGAAPTGPSPITLPGPVMWSGLGLFLALVVIAIAGAWAWWRFTRFRGTQPEEPKSNGSPHDKRRSRQVAAFRALHDMIGEKALRAIGVLFTVGMVLAIGFTVLAQVRGRPVGPTPTGWELAVKIALDIGNSLAGLLPLVIAALGVLVYRSDRVRRYVGIVWDVGTFWPRASHPFAPPCYAERAVPELVTRTAGLLAAERVNWIILSGHSQGSVICAAVIFQLPQRFRDRVWFFTYGCQLTGLYGKAFPAYFNTDQLAELSGLLTLEEKPPPRWTNFWRPTDPIGWQVVADHNEIRVPDPEALHPSDGCVDDPPIRNHSGYPAATEFCEERDRVCNLLVGPGYGNGSGPSQEKRGMGEPAGIGAAGSP